MKLDSKLKRQIEIADALLTALMKGRVKAFDLPKCGVSRLSMTEMCDAVNYLNRCGIHVSRIDSGGNPTWDILSVDHKTLKAAGENLLTFFKKTV